jgi:hypothetical protein
VNEPSLVIEAPEGAFDKLNVSVCTGTSPSVTVAVKVS